MKQFVAVVVFALITVSSAAAFAGKCGTNTGRNSNTTPTTSQPSGNSSAGAGVKH